MNATDRARRSDSLHYDYVGRRTLCDMVANLESDLEDVKAENAKLWELGKQYELVIADYRAEVAKLRELTQRMWRLERFGCYGCRHECDAESCYASDCKEAVEIEQHMRDLGIEVDE